jgi:hypothetical protein
MKLKFENIAKLKQWLSQLADFIEDLDYLSISAEWQNGKRIYYVEVTS